MKAELYHNAEKQRLEIIIYPENKAEEVMVKVLHKNKSEPYIDATGNQPYFCRIHIAVPIDF